MVLDVDLVLSRGDRDKRGLVHGQVMQRACTVHGEHAEHRAQPWVERQRPPDGRRWRWHIPSQEASNDLSPALPVFSVITVDG